MKKIKQIYVYYIRKKSEIIYKLDEERKREQKRKEKAKRLFSFFFKSTFCVHFYVKNFFLIIFTS